MVSILVRPDVKGHIGGQCHAKKDLKDRTQVMHMGDHRIYTYQKSRLGGWIQAPVRNPPRKRWILEEL